LKEHCELLKNKDKPTPDEIKGVTEVPLFPAIEVESCKFPLLHGLQLATNHCIKQFYLFINYMVEDISPAILEARITTIAKVDRKEVF
jgi:hypothetical protein